MEEGHVTPAYMRLMVGVVTMCLGPNCCVLLKVGCYRNSAYKHISVCLEDHSLQVLSFGGRFFIETQLTFESKSSPDRFDLISDLPLEFALLRSNMKRSSIIKQLDDVVGFGRK